MPQPPMPEPAIGALLAEIRACRLCAPRFAATATGHDPRPVAWFQPGARLLIAGQAPGRRVHASGRPFTDPSGERLRRWTGLSEAEFYDLSRVAVVPMAFCFPGQTAAGADLPPPPLCARTWRGRVMAALPEVRLTLALGAAAIRWHLGPVPVPVPVPVAQAVADWRGWAVRGLWPLPHPSWRNTGWLNRNPWFEAEVLPALRQTIRAVMEDRPLGPQPT